MTWCQLSRVIRVETRRIERQNDRLDAFLQSSATWGEELEARCVARNAETAAGYARLARFNQIKNATHEDITAYLDEANADARRFAVARSVD